MAHLLPRCCSPLSLVNISVGMMILKARFGNKPPDGFFSACCRKPIWKTWNPGCLAFEAGINSLFRHICSRLHHAVRNRQFGALFGTVCSSLWKGEYQWIIWWIRKCGMPMMRVMISMLLVWLQWLSKSDPKVSVLLASGWRSLAIWSLKSALLSGEHCCIFCLTIYFT